MLWSKEHKDLLRKLWPNHSAQEIGERLGRSRHAIESQAMRSGLPKKDHKIRWEKDDEAVAIQMRKNGHSSLQIAQLLNKTRNSVIGFLNRLGIRAHTPIREKKVKPPPRLPRTPLPKPRPLPPTGKGIHLLRRQPEQCAWIIEKHIMCGALITEKSSSWCPFHKEIVFRKDAA